MKKQERDGKDFKSEIAKEIADIQTYLDLLASSMDIDLGKSTINKFNEVSDRIGSGVKL